MSIPSNSQTPETDRRLIRFWENLHPLARNNLGITLIAIVAWLLLYGLTYAAPRLLSLNQVFQIAVVERLWYITSIVLIIVLVFNAIRLGIRLIQKKISWVSLALGGASIAIVALTTLMLPSFFEASISYAMGQPYNEVFSGFKTLCDRWDARYPEDETITLRINEEDLGLFQNRPEVEVRRERQVVFFNFGDDEKTFGLACALGGDEPHTTGRAADYEYEPIRKQYYKYIEQPDS